MAHIYLLFDFGTDEERAQQARHKLEGWKQAFRLDKKLLYKLDRGEAVAGEAPEKASKAEASKTEASKAEKGKAKAKQKADAEPAKEAAAPNGKVSLLVRLYFSSHEKLSAQRWVERIPSEEPFKGASPRVVREGEAQFDEVLKQFESLD